jgi:hypothetical protein
MAQFGYSNYPAAQGPYVYPQEYLEPDMEEQGRYDGGDFTRTQADVERVIGIVQQSLANEIGQMVSLGLNQNVIAYFIRELVTYLDRNYNKYTSALLINDITAATEDIKTRFYWVFDIMRLYGVPFVLQMRFLYSTVRTAFQNLRPAPTAPTPAQMPTTTAPTTTQR